MNTTTTARSRTPDLEGAGVPAAESPAPDARTSSRPPRGTGIAESLATACALLLCVVARVPHWLVETTGARGWALRVVVVVAAVSAARALARAPFTHPRFSDPGEWAAAETKTLVVTAIVGVAVGLPLYALLRTTSLWWLYAAVLFAAVTVVGQLTTPFTLRFQSGPLVPAPAGLADRVLAVAARAGVDAGTVWVTDKTGVAGCNAYVVGLGPTRRIVLGGTLASWPLDVVDQVVAHELGHCRLGHAARRLPLAVAAQLGTLALAAFALSWTPLLHWAGVDHIGDPRSFPFLLLVTPVVALPARCLLAWRDRSQERTADQFALSLLGAPASFASMLDRAATDGGAARRLPWWRRVTASHPPIDERVLACTRFASTS